MATARHSGPPSSGLQVALVDEDKVGGTCLHRGCIPTKALLESAEMVNRARHLKDYGVVLAGEPEIDYATIAARRDAVVKRMWTGLKSLVDKNKVTWIAGRGRLDGPNRINVRQPGEDGTPGDRRRADPPGDRRDHRHRQPGQEPARPGARRHDDRDQRRHPAPGQQAPASIVIVGGGAVGVEFASFYHDIGTAVTLLEYLPGIVPLEDREVSQLLERSFTKRGIKVITNARFDVAAVKTGQERASA